MMNPISLGSLDFPYFLCFLPSLHFLCLNAADFESPASDYCDFYRPESESYAARVALRLGEDPDRESPDAVDRDHPGVSVELPRMLRLWQHSPGWRGYAQ